MNSNMHKTSINFRGNYPFILTETDLAKLNTAIRDFLGTNATIDFAISCRDEITRHFPLVSNLIKYENPKDREIKGITITGNSKNYDRSIRIHMDSPAMISNLNVTIEGPENASVSLRQKNKEYLRGMRPWYGYIASADILGIITIFSFFGFFIFFTIGFFRGELTQTNLISFPISGCFYLFLIYIFLSLLLIFRWWLFPMGVFEIGQGIKRNKTKAKFRSVILVCIFLSFLIGLASSLIATYVFNYSQSNVSSQ